MREIEREIEARMRAILEPAHADRVARLRSIPPRLLYAYAAQMEAEAVPDRICWRRRAALRLEHHADAQIAP